MIWLTLLVVAILVILWLVTDHYLADPNYKPAWHRLRCHGRRCGLVILAYALLFIFLSLPIWIKMPVAAGLAGEAIARLLALLTWSFDRHPDFAIGPQGVFGLGGVKYHHVAWADVTGVQLQTAITLLGTTESLRIRTKLKRPSWRALVGGRKVQNVQLSIAPIHGLPIQEIAKLIAAYAPEIEISKVTVKSLPKWLQ